MTSDDDHVVAPVRRGRFSTGAAGTVTSAHEQYDDEERAHRVAYSALKHPYEKVGEAFGQAIARTQD